MQLQIETGFLEVEGGRLYYEVAGEGHPLVLVHAGVADCTMWDEQFGLFARQYRVIRYDTRGYGKTTTQEVSFSNRQDLYDLLKHLGVDKTYVIGVSRGGQIAVDFTLEHPEMVDALMPVASGLGGYSYQAPQAEMDKFAQMDEAYEAGDFARLIELEVAMWADGPNRSREQGDPRVQQRLREMLAFNYENQKVEPKARPLEPPAAGRLSEINVPTLVIVGDQDTSDTLASCEALAQGIRGAKKLVFENVAHMVNMERPGEFNKAALGFLGGI